VLLAVLCQQSWSAETSGSRFAHSASDSITPFLLIGEAALLCDRDCGHDVARQGARALAATGLVTQLLKCTVREKRPNSSSKTSFPSGHTSAAFAMATVLADYKPSYRVPAFGIASAIAWSRVEVGAHRWDDVIAGAAIGYYTAKRYTRSRVSATPIGLSFQWKM
jgi:membrane-associated phospholipid phosphatase